MFGIMVGVYGCLWASVGLLSLIFGLRNISAAGLGGLASMLAIFFVAPLTLVFAALLLMCAIGLWRGARWARSGIIVLAIAQLLGALFLFFRQIWLIGLVAAALSGTALWYLRRTSPGRSLAH
jgi:uncharacterized membrane protein (DUF2068 family)